jgi:hypothetical protein
MAHIVHQPILAVLVRSLEDQARRARLGIPEKESAILRGFTEAEVNTFRMWVLSWDCPSAVLASAVEEALA